MALNLAVSTEIGVTANYWRISHISVGCDEPVINANVRLWVSQDARQAGARPMPTLDRNYAFPQADLPALDGNLPITSALKAALYTHLKTLPEWAGAQDC